MHCPLLLALLLDTLYLRVRSDALINESTGCWPPPSDGTTFIWAMPSFIMKLISKRFSIVCEYDSGLIRNSNGFTPDADCAHFRRRIFLKWLTRDLVSVLSFFFCFSTFLGWIMGAVVVN